MPMIDPQTGQPLPMPSPEEVKADRRRRLIRWLVGVIIIYMGFRGIKYLLSRMKSKVPNKVAMNREWNAITNSSQGGAMSEYGNGMYNGGMGMYGNNMYGNSMYGGGMYGNSMYGNSMYGGGMYGNSMYGNSMYGNSGYGNSMYGNSMYGGSSYGGRLDDYW